MAAQTPLVSVIVPTYNRPERLVRSLESIAEQTYDELEIVVVDDCSETPASEAIEPLRDEFPYELVVIRHDENRGANAARNTGIREASGEFLAFLDDDDEWAPSKVRRQVAAFRRAPEDVGLVYTALQLVDDDGEEIRTTDASVSGDVTRTLLCRNAIGSFSCVMVRNAAVDDAGLLDEEFPSWQDLDWYIRISEEWRVEAIPEPLVTNHAGSHDRITDDLESLIQETYPRFLWKHRPRAASYGRFFERKMRAWAAFRVGAWYALPAGQYETAQRFVRRAIALYPLEPQFFLYAALAAGGEPANSAFETVKRSIPH
ncbi:glycosyltransferase family 2 protein [Halopiger xanaduensis]|uniref:Glycosyl transferase family 2 n=1 Tax=Halopiger xanaduensis (strain DSM 18323 / JCM 14033 / SH-6) TaxID=797210 RepID=F8DA43_HALXS|nr:glycosyltransferase family 2 protein [Halopiger xanaduensis]AEH36966.1 glycosyl transferase family 2 [Halopiger xanaduensis SH-6]